MTLSHRSPAVDRRQRPRKTRAAHRSPAARRRRSGSGQSQPQTTASRRCRRASTCSLSPAAFRLTLAAGRFISGGFMGAECCGNRPGGGTFDYTQASRPDLVPITGWTSSDGAGCREAAPHSRPHNVKSNQVRHIKKSTSACVFQNKLSSSLCLLSSIHTTHCAFNNPICFKTLISVQTRWTLKQCFVFNQVTYIHWYQ